MAITRAQAGGGTFANNVASIARAYSSNITSGNLISVSVVKVNDSGSDPFVVGDISQTAGTATLGTWTLDVETVFDTGGLWRHVGVFSAPVTGTGSCTITVSGGAGNYWIIGEAEYAGADTSATRVADTATGTGTGTSAASGNADSTGGAVFVGIVSTHVFANVTHTEDGAFTVIFEKNDAGTASSASGAAIDQIVSGATTDSADWSLSTSVAWVAALAVYKETVTATPSAPPARVRFGRTLRAQKRRRIL